MEELIEKSLSGDEKAYAELIELVKYDLYRIATSRLRNSDDVEDAFQETIIKSYQNLSSLREKAYFETWIKRILINECNNISKNRNKNATLFNKVVDKIEHSTYSKTTDNINNTIFMEELFDKLEDDEKEIAYLYFRDNFTTEKISELLHSNRNTVKSKIYRIRLKLKKLAMLILILCVITTTAVFAKEIIEFIISLFTTSRQAIDVAVENDYVQNVNMDFVYDEDIGVKVDYILIDNKNLDVSYVFDCKTDGDITSIELLDYTITDENENKIFCSDLDCITRNSDDYGEHIEIDDNMFRYSNLYVAKNYFPISNKLVFNLSSVLLQKNNEYIPLDGNWNFEIDLEDKFLKRDYKTYIASYSEYINDISTNIDETCLTIKINLNTCVDENIILDSMFDNNLLLENSLTKQKYKLLTLDTLNDENNLGYIELKYDIGKYYEDIDKLNLSIKFDENKFINITLKK